MTKHNYQYGSILLLIYLIQNILNIACLTIYQSQYPEFWDGYSLAHQFARNILHAFDLQPELFFTTELREKLNISKDKNCLRTSAPLSDTYFIETKMDSFSKFERIKKALTIFDMEDELIIKYKEIENSKLPGLLQEY